MANTSSTEKPRRYAIRDREGHERGVVHAVSPGDALLQFHRAAGHGEDVVTMDGNRLVFSREDYRNLCGDLEHWDVRELHS